MRVGVHVTKFDHPAGSAGIGPELAAVGQSAEAAGIGWLSVMDHYFQMEHNGGALDHMMEGYTTLGFLAAHTSTIELSLLVTGVTYRHPGLLAKIVTTLDVLSGGRGTLGIGAAWYEREHLGLGVPFPPLAERFERLEEALEICKQMWSADEGPFEGKHYRLAETICRPRPIQQPGPPILIGGSGEKKTLKLVARHGDACNLFGVDLPTVKHKLEVLEHHCAAEGRDPTTIDKTILGFGDPVNDPDGFVASMAEFAGLGVDLVEIMPPGPDPVGYVSQVCETVLPRLAELG